MAYWMILWMVVGMVSFISDCTSNLRNIQKSIISTESYIREIDIVGSNQKYVPKDYNNIIYRSWFYLRQGWSNYLTFLMSAVNTLTITYFLALEKYQPLSQIFPNFIQYVMIISAVGIPSLVALGYTHWKKSRAREAETDIFYETNPYIVRILVNTEIMIKLNLKLTEKLLSSARLDGDSQKDIDELKRIQNEISEFTMNRKFRSKAGPSTHDWEFFKKEIERKK